MCCGKGRACDGQPRPTTGRQITTGDPAGLTVATEHVSAAAGRGELSGAETRAAVATQDHEVPWLFARTRRPEGFQAETFGGEHARIPSGYRVPAPVAVQMDPWAETPPTVVRQRPRPDDGVGSSSCR